MTIYLKRQYLKCIVLILLFFFISSSVPVFVNAKTPSNSVDIGIDCLLSTFDLTKSQELIRANTRAIIDKDKVESSELSYGMLAGAKSYAENFAGSNAVSYAQDAGVNITSSISEEISFSTLFKLNLSSKIDTSVKSAYRTSAESYFNTFKVTREVGINKAYLVSDADFEILRSILNENFKNALYNADTKEEVEALYDLYGTHMITSYALGGWAEATTSTVNVSEERKNELSMAYSSEAEEKAELGDFGAGLKIAFSAQGNLSTEYNSSGYKTTAYNKVCGGVGGLNFGDSSDANDVYNSWIASINPYDTTTTEIIADRNTEFIPLWDILPNEYAVQKSLMKQVYLERLGVFNNEFNRTFIYSTGEMIDIESLPVRLKADDESINTSAVPEGYIPIYTPAQFTAIGKGEYPLNEKYLLMNDLDFTELPFESIGGCGEESFSGLFDGNGYTIKNIDYTKTNVNSVEYCGGIFSENKGVIKNLTLENIKFDLATKENAGIKKGTHAIGVLCGKNSGTINKCKIISSDISYRTDIRKGVDNTITSCMGAVAGINAGTIRFAGVEKTKCYLKNYLQEATNSSKNILLMGGLVGKSINGSISDCYVIDSAGLQVKGTSFHDAPYTIFAYHTPIMNAFVGGILGDSEGDKNLIERCFVKSVYSSEIIKNDLSITQKGPYESSDNTKKYIGSIIGNNRKNNNTIRSCYYMDGPEYGKSGWLLNIVIKEINAPEGCEYLNSLQAVKNTFVSNGWTMAADELYPSFAAEDRTFSIVIDSRQIKGGVYADDILDMSEIKIYLCKEYDYSAVYEDITDDAWILYDFGNGEAVSKIQIVYFNDDFVCCGELPIRLSVNKIKSLEIDNFPERIRFSSGMRFDCDGLVLKANYLNGSYGYITDGYTTNYDGALFTQTGKYTVTVSYNESTVQYDVLCGECENHSFIEVVDEKYKFADATCEKGTIYYKSCFICKVKGTETFEYGPSIGHIEVPHSAKAPGCTEIGWDAYVTCSRADCGYTTYSELPALGHLEVPHSAKVPGCTEIGWDAYVTCGRADCGYTTYSELPALGHLEVPHSAKAPSCTEIGWDAYVICGRTNCGYTTYSEKSANGHTVVKDNAVEATCDKTGLTEGAHCSVCKQVLTAQTVTAKKGHTFGEWQIAENATTSKAGKETRECKNCKKTEDRELPMLKPEKIVAHKTAENVVIKDGYAFINENTAVSDILKETNGTAVYLQNNLVKDSGTKLATGMKIVLTDGGKTVDSVTVVVLGDVNGDGTVSAADARIALRYSVNLEELKDESLEAAMVNGAVKVSAAEARLILRASVKLEDNRLWLKKVS